MAYRGLPLITYASRGGGGVNTDAYKCVQGGRGGLNMTKCTHSVRRFIVNATMSEIFKDRRQLSVKNSLCSCKFHFYNPLLRMFSYIIHH